MILLIGILMNQGLIDFLSSHPEFAKIDAGKANFSRSERPDSTGLIRRDTKDLFFSTTNQRRKKVSRLVDIFAQERNIVLSPVLLLWQIYKFIG